MFPVAHLLRIADAAVAKVPPSTAILSNAV